MNRHFNKIFLPFLILIIGISSCKKSGTLVMATSGTPPTLTASATTLNYTEADSSHTAITFTYTPSNYGYNAAIASELDFSYNDSNFSSIKNYTLSVDTLSMAFTVAELNNLVLGLNYVAGVKDTVFVRVKSTLYGAKIDNNPVVTYSDTLAIVLTPYSQVPVPVITPPDSLYIVGDATPGGWSNPVPTPSQKFSQIDEYGQVFGMILQLNAGGSFLFLSKNGTWDKYGGSTAGSGTLLVGDDVPSSNTPGPTTSGLYEIIVNFTKGTYSVTAVTTNPIPANLYIVGDATPGGWTNPVPVPSQQFTQVSNAEFQLTVPLVATGTYLFLPVNDNVWSTKYGGSSATGGTLLYNGDVPSSNTPGPTVSATYLIDVNFLANTYSLTKQ